MYFVLVGDVCMSQQAWSCPVLLLAWSHVLIRFVVRPCSIMGCPPLSVSILIWVVRDQEEERKMETEIKRLGGTMSSTGEGRRLSSCCVVDNSRRCFLDDVGRESGIRGLTTRRQMKKKSTRV